MQITVLGTESPPTFHDAPEGPYKMQKELVITHIYDELWYYNYKPSFQFIFLMNKNMLVKVYILNSIYLVYGMD